MANHYLERIRASIRRITWNNTFKAGLALAGISAVGAGLTAIVAPALGLSIGAALSAKASELVISGIAGLVTVATAGTSQRDAVLVADADANANANATQRGTDTQLEIERIRDSFRSRALTAIVALLAYFAIAVPVGFLVLEFAAKLPISSGVIVGCYAYIGLARFVGFDEVTAPIIAAANRLKLSIPPAVLPQRSSPDTQG
jgi:hypothetical protein